MALAVRLIEKMISYARRSTSDKKIKPVPVDSKSRTVTRELALLRVIKPSEYFPGLSQQGDYKIGTAKVYVDVVLVGGGGSWISNQ